jgi:hypothetical protein
VAEAAIDAGCQSFHPAHVLLVFVAKATSSSWMMIVVDEETTRSTAVMGSATPQN